YLRAPWFRDVAPGPLVYHTRLSLRFGCGALFALLTLPALAFAAWRGGASRLIAVAALGHFVLLAGNPLVLTRHFRPFVPALSLLIAFAAASLLARFHLGRQWRRSILALIAIALTFEPLAQSLEIDRVLHAPDTREIAARWIAENLPQGSRIVS